MGDDGYYTEQVDMALMAMRLQTAALQRRQAVIKQAQLEQALHQIVQDSCPTLYHELTARQHDDDDHQNDGHEYLLDLLSEVLSGIRDVVIPTDDDLTSSPASTSPTSPPPPEEKTAAMAGTPVVTGEVVRSEIVETGTVPPEAEPKKAVLPVTDTPLEGLELEVLRIIGEGEFLSGQALAIFKGLSIVSNLSPESRTTYFYNSLSSLAARGLVVIESYDLGFSNEMRKRCPAGKAFWLTEAGQDIYRQRFEAEPQDRYTPFVSKYKTVAAGLFIRLVKEIIEELNDLPIEEQTMSYRVIDTVWDGDDPEVMATIPGAKKSYPAPDKSTWANPDLIVMMTPRLGGEPVTAVIEVERAGYKLADLRRKWDRAVLCYPPMPIYVIAPNGRTRGKLHAEFRRAIERAKERRGLPHPVRVASYVPDEIVTSGLMTPRQISKLLRRVKQNPDVAKEIALPMYWGEKATEARD